MIYFIFNVDYCDLFSHTISNRITSKQKPPSENEWMFESILKRKEEKKVAIILKEA